MYYHFSYYFYFRYQAPSLLFSCQFYTKTGNKKHPKVPGYADPLFLFLYAYI